MDAEMMRGMMRDLGEPVRWFKAVPSSDYNPRTNISKRKSDFTTEFGFVYVEKTLDSGIRVFITDEKAEIVDPIDNTRLITGDAQIKVMPDEIELGKMDKIIAIKRRRIITDVITRGTDATDVLPQTPVVGIDAVMQGDTEFIKDTDWKINDENSDAIEWLDGGNAPETGKDYSIRFVINPTYWYLGLLDKTARVDDYGVYLPQRGVLTLKHPAVIA